MLILFNVRQFNIVTLYFRSAPTPKIPLSKSRSASSDVIQSDVSKQIHLLNVSKLILVSLVHSIQNNFVNTNIGEPTRFQINRR